MPRRRQKRMEWEWWRRNADTWWTTKGSRPSEKGATEVIPRKSSLRSTEKTGAKSTTLKAPNLAAALPTDSTTSGTLQTIGFNFLKRHHFPIAVALSFVLVMAFTFFLGTFMPVPQPPGALSTLSCPEESHAVLRALYYAVKPCDDFYSYVCSRIDAGKPEPFSPLMKGAVTSALVSFNGMEFRHSAAGMISAALHNSRDTTASPGSGLVDYVRAIMLASAIDTTSPMTVVPLVRFFALLSLRYKLPAVVSFKVSGSLLRLERNDGCFLNVGNRSVINASELRAINEALHTGVSLRDLMRVEEDLARLRDTGNSFSQTSGIATSPFSDLSDSDWTAILKEILFPVYPDLDNVQRRRGDRLSQVIHALTQTRQPLSVAYAVICTAIRTRDSVHRALARTVPSLESPAFQALDICEIEDAVLATATRAECRNQFISGFFDRIRSTVAIYAEKLFVLNETARTTLIRKLDGVRLAFPEEMVASHVAVPAVTETFAANLLAARSYTFDVMREKVARNIPVRESLFSRSAIRHRNIIYLPTYLYTLVPQRCEPRGNEFPAVGMELSFQLWSFLLDEFWPTEENWKTETHLECFRRTHVNASDSVGYRRIASATLALTTMFDAVLPQQRRNMFNIIGVRVSLERFAFILWLFDRCSFLPEWLKPGEVNVVLKNVAAFSAAFDCPKSNNCLGQ